MYKIIASLPDLDKSNPEEIKVGKNGKYTEFTIYSSDTYYSNRGEKYKTNGKGFG